MKAKSLDANYAGSHLIIRRAELHEALICGVSWQIQGLAELAPPRERFSEIGSNVHRWVLNSRQFAKFA